MKRLALLPLLLAACLSAAAGVRPFALGEVRLLPGRFTENMRRLSAPELRSEGVAVRLNGRKVRVKADAAGYLVLVRSWKAGDRVDIDYPMPVRVEPAPQDPSVGVVMRGPVVLARRLGTEGFVGTQLVSDPSKYNDYYTYDDHIPASLPAFAPLPERFDALEPLYDIHGERYEVYWSLK